MRTRTVRMEPFVCVQKNKNVNDMYRCFKHIVFIAQLFGLMPVEGIKDSRPNKIEFKWYSWKSVYSYSIIILTIFVVVMSVYDLLYIRSLALPKTTNTAFYTNGLLTSIIFLDFSKKWKKIMQNWEKSELALVYYRSRRALIRKINVIMLVVLINASVEHALSNVNLYFRVVSKMGRNNVERHFFFAEYPYIFKYVPYSRALAVCLKVVTLVNTFSWNFMDVFIMQVSCCLAERFCQLNDKIKRLCFSQERSESTWGAVRSDYNVLCRLCKRVDSEMSNIILMSFGNNMFFISVQLYKSMRKRDNNIQRIYFLFSFALLLCRTVAVCLFGARVNYEGTKSLKFIPFIQSNSYCLEVDRLVEQIRTERVALTGKGLFRITRNMIFRIAGTIVTYELFLFQFNVNSNY